MKNIIILLLSFASIVCKAQTTPSNLVRIDSVITINLTDQTMGNTILKRKAILFGMFYNMHAKQLVLDWTVNYYADSSNTYGSIVSLPGILSYPVEFIADNNPRYTNAANGAIQNYDSTYSGNAGYNPALMLMTQYEWFTQLAATQSVNVFNMIYEFGITGFQARGDY